MQELPYRLTDGLVLPLRGLTWSKEDDAANESLYVWEALDDAWRKLDNQLSGHDENGKPCPLVPTNKQGDHAALVAKTRMAARQAGRDFLLKYANGKFGQEDIIAKVIPQLTDADSIAIMRTAREGIGWHDRYLESLWSRDQITMLENKLSVLCATEAGKAYLSELLPAIQKHLQPEPESTTQPTPPS